MAELDLGTLDIPGVAVLNFNKLTPKKVYHTPFTDLEHLNGKPFTIIGRVSTDKVDEVEVGAMFELEVDGLEVQAYMEEVFEEFVYDGKGTYKFVGVNAYEEQLEPWDRL